MNRKTVEVEGFSHAGQPIPAASRKGNIVMTGGVYGLDRDQGALPDDLAEQTALMFDNLKLILEAAGSNFDDVVKLTVFVKDGSCKEYVNEHWLKAFPDPKSRPARHTLVNSYLPANMLVQCDAMAVLD